MESIITLHSFSKTCVKWPLSKRLEVSFQYQLSLNAGKIFVLSIFEWPFYTGFTVYAHKMVHTHSIIIPVSTENITRKDDYIENKWLLNETKY